MKVEVEIMTANEFRIKNPNCSYCEYNYGYCKGFLKIYCEAKQKEYLFNKAKKCPIYSPKKIY